MAPRRRLHDNILQESLVRHETREAATGVNDMIRGGPTATEQLAELAERSHACNGLLLPVPVEITRESVKAWLMAIAEIGSPGHVEIAWHRLERYGELKQSMVDHEYAAACNAAARRHHALERRAAAEQEAERVAWLERTRIANRKRDIAQAEARLAVLKASP